MWVVEPFLWNPAAPGTDYQECVADNGEPGTVYTIHKDGVLVGKVCISETDQILRDSPEPVVVRAFKRFDWPGSTVSTQPADGRTLVNLDTIFFTDNTEPHRQEITLAGWEVVIEATPIEYTWHFGDGESMTTTSPGQPYPDEDVVHAFRRTGEVSVSVDTTYAGRFTIRGGPWREIPTTLTVAGEAVGLSVLEARPELVVD